MRTLYLILDVTVGLTLLGGLIGAVIDRWRS